MIRRVHVRDLAGYIDKMPKERHAAAVKHVRRTLKQRGRVIVREEINATPKIPVDCGEYLRSWQVVDIPDGVRIFSTSPYASIIERGRRPGFWSNIQALIGWVHRHGLVNQSSLASTVSKRQGKFDNFLVSSMSDAKRRAAHKKIAKFSLEGAERSIAFAIAAAIKRRGLPAKHVFERASKRIIEECRDACRSAFAKHEDVA